MTIEINVLKGFTEIHGRVYEMYCGYATPNQLIEYAAVPSFPRNMDHNKIALGLKNPPVDHWQRPLDTERISKLRIKIDSAIQRNPSKDSLMANPVLIGRSNKLGIDGVDIEIKPVTVNEPGRPTQQVPNLYSLKLSYLEDKKPLWILDGQHRIHGLGNSPFITDQHGNQIPNGSIVADQTIPVVFVVDEERYNAKFLAKIFTEVTTEAQKMAELHGDWMQYAFDMKHYSLPNEKTGMSATIELTTIQEVDGITNPFYANGGQIRFNPHNDFSGVGPLVLDARDFRKMFAAKYFSRLVTRDSDVGKTQETLRVERSSEVANTFVRFYRASRDADSYSENGSRLFDNEKAWPKMAHYYFNAFLDYLATNPDLNNYSKDEWVEFLCHEERQFDECDWRMSDLDAGPTGKYYKPSEKALRVTFSRFFNNPSSFDYQLPSAWLMGPGHIQVQTAIDGTRFPTTNYEPTDTLVSGGGATLNLRVKGHKMIRFRDLENSQTSILNVERKVGNDYVALDKRHAIRLTERQEYIQVTTSCYGDIEEITTFTITT